MAILSDGGHCMLCELSSIKGLGLRLANNSFVIVNVYS